jgi:hypothetical protein
MMVLFLFDLSAYILCRLSSIDRLASSIDDACALDSGTVDRARAVELICRRPRRDTLFIVEVEAKGIGIEWRVVLAVHAGHAYHQKAPSTLDSPAELLIQSLH